MTIAERLDDALDRDALEGYEPCIDPATWTIDTLDQVDWALRKLGKANAEAHQVSETAERRIATIEAWRGAEHKRLGARRDHWTSLLELYHRQRLAEDDDAKTIRRDCGTLTARKLPDGVDIPNPEAFVPWALIHQHQLLRHVPQRWEIDLAAVKEAVLKAGEILPGVSATVGEVRFTVTTEVAP
jgi:phage host-nuclease inhibitor protein Gam